MNNFFKKGIDFYGVKKIKCHNCGATMEIDKDLETFVCKYCRSKIFINDTGSKVNRVLKAFTNATERLQEQNLNYQKSQQNYLNSNEYKQTQKRTLLYLSLIVGIFLLFCLLIIIMTKI